MGYPSKRASETRFVTPLVEKFQFIPLRISIAALAAFVVTTSVAAGWRLTGKG